MRRPATTNLRDGAENPLTRAESVHARVCSGSYTSVLLVISTQHLTRAHTPKHTIPHVQMHKQHTLEAPIIAGIVVLVDDHTTPLTKGALMEEIGIAEPCNSSLLDKIASSTNNHDLNRVWSPRC